MTSTAPIAKPPGGPRWLLPTLVGIALLIAALAMAWAVGNPDRGRAPEPSPEPTSER